MPSAFTGIKRHSTSFRSRADSFLRPGKSGQGGVRRVFKRGDGHQPLGSDKAFSSRAPGWHTVMLLCEDSSFEDQNLRETWGKGHEEVHVPFYGSVQCAQIGGRQTKRLGACERRYIHAAA